ncbi:MAG: flagellin [Nitrospiraceae bacterium]|nr:flagellin [Nitrospiraceae bacterium]
MAINDISLTSAMRSNLVSLQGTVDLLSRTQNRLSTGKKVNSALDNPLNYFTALALNSRANDLAGYKDAMSEAVQTIKAANNGISSISALISQAKAVAASAKASGSGTGNVTASINVGTLSAGDTITIGGTTYTAVAGTANTTTQFAIGSNAQQTAFNLAQLINSATETCDFVVTAVNGTSLSVGKSVAADVVAGDITFPGTQTSMSSSLVSANTDRGNYAQQYNTIMAQLDLVAADSGYKGVNFLAGNSLDVQFGPGATDKITIDTNSGSFDASAAGLTMNVTATSSWATNTNIDTDTAKMDTALNTLKAQASKLSSSLSVINVRQDWVTSMTNTLTEGADKLTLADMNEEGANMLMLQTRNSLGTTALSLSSQAAQSVLRLFG